ncbi:MAG TPA: efflux RND transporter periplasmic adaptor subunit [Burkholderiales bacterium]|nr:efflux RND transporter periplasmic adaptor subunit [Burkholderiales bacterium]
MKLAPVLLPLVALAVVAVAGVVNHNGLDSPPALAATSEIPVVRTTTPEVAAASSALRLPARTAPVEQASIFARATGVISERRVDIGARVQRGDVLAIVIAPEVDQSLNRARANLNQAKAREQLAEANLMRSRQLVDQGFLSKQVLDERQSTFDAAVADRRSAEAEVKRIGEIRGFQTVRAPFTGVIAERRVDRGDRVVGDSGNAESYLFKLVRTDELRVTVDVPQAAVMQMRQSLPAQVTFAELPGEKFPAKIVRTAGVIDARSGTMAVELALPNPDGRIPPGMLGEVHFAIGRVQPVLLVPNSTLIVHDGKPQVVSVREGKLRFLPVQPGRNLGTKTEILAGLDQAATLVTNPNALLRDGDAVSIAPPAAPPKAAH